MTSKVKATTNLSGERDSGRDVRTNNVTAVMAIANIVKNTLGPLGLDKMLVDDIGDVTITNDGATILKQLEVEHPAAKVIVDLAILQDKEVGDGTTSVVILAAELLKRANELIAQKLHPTTIISGYKLAVKHACKYIEEKLSKSVSELGEDAMFNVAKTSMSSKLIGPESNKFAKLVVEAVKTVKMINTKGDIKYPIKAINIVKSHGQSLLDSELIKGIALQTSRVSQQMPTRIENAKIACLDMNLQKFKLELAVQVVVTDPKNLEKIRQRECDILKERLKKIIDAGANVILTTKAIDDIAAKYMVESKCIGLRRVSKPDMRRIAKATGATIMTNLANAEGEETFDPNVLGIAKEVYEQAVGDNDFVFICEPKNQSIATLMVRGANLFLLDEIERSLHDAICVVKRALEAGKIVAGGGATEVALSIALEDYAKKIPTKEQIVIAEFSEALTIIPKTLAVNAALDATDLLSKLRFLHSISQNHKENEEYKEEYRWSGLDLVNGKCRNNLTYGVLEPMDGKIKCLKFATEAAITILRIDDMIKLNPQKEQMPNEMGRMGPMGGM